MDTLPLLAVAGAAVGGALAGAAACYWPLSRLIATLRERLERSEQARNGAVERSAQAREQIARLNRAITELRLAHSTHSAQDASRTAREQVEKVLADGDGKTAARSPQEQAPAFADTQVMSKL
jgi:phage shock protein A